MLYNDIESAENTIYTMLYNLCTTIQQEVVFTMMISIKDYASSKGVSYEAVRKQIGRYSADLAGHISKTGKTQMLDEYAVQFLDSKRNNNAVAQYNIQRNSELEEAQATIEELTAQLEVAKKKVLDQAEEIKEATQHQLRLEAEKSSIKDEELKKREELIERYAQKEEAHYEKLASKDEEIAVLKAQLQTANDTVKAREEELEKQRKRTLWQRIFNT